MFHKLISGVWVGRMVFFSWHARGHFWQVEIWRVHLFFQFVEVGSKSWSVSSFSWENSFPQALFIFGIKINVLNGSLNINHFGRIKIFRKLEKLSRNKNYNREQSPSVSIFWVFAWQKGVTLAKFASFLIFVHRILSVIF